MFFHGLLVAMKSCFVCVFTLTQDTEACQKFVLFANKYEMLF